MSKIISCPRCGERSYEKLQTHSHCLNCLYSEDFSIEKFCREMRDFMTLREAESILKAAEVVELPIKRKNKIDGEAS